MATAYSIRPAKLPDLERIMQLIDHSRSIMRAVGNASQWVGYPGPDLIGSDMARGIGHVILQGGQIVGYFALLLDPEPTYAYIEDGQWIDDTTPYGTLHRLACAPGVQGIARSAFSFAEERCASVRVDTHRDNPIMLHIIAGRGYTRCGVVYMRDGSPREAFQKMTYPMVTPSLRNYVELRYCRATTTSMLHTGWTTSRPSWRKAWNCGTCWKSRGRQISTPTWSIPLPPTTTRESWRGVSITTLSPVASSAGTSI